MWKAILEKSDQIHKGLSPGGSPTHALDLCLHNLQIAKESNKTAAAKEAAALAVFFFARVCRHYCVIIPARLWRAPDAESFDEIIDAAAAQLKSMRAVVDSDLSHVPQTEATIDGLAKGLAPYLSALWKLSELGKASDLEAIGRHASCAEWAHGSFSPVCSNAAAEIRSLAQVTACPFGATGKYWGAPDWDASVSFEENIARIVPAFREFLAVAKRERLDGWALSMPGIYSSSADVLGNTVSATVQAMWDITDPDWRLNPSQLEQGFSLDGEHMFISAFGSCYDESNPRYLFGRDKTLLFFQPDFTLRNHPALTPGTEPATRAKIKSLFGAVGMEYTNETSPKEVERYVRSERAGTRVIRWSHVLGRE